MLLNLGTLGSVSDGKSEMIYQLSGGVRTQRDSREKKRNITIKAGYANIKIWECDQCKSLYSSQFLNENYLCEKCQTDCQIINTISFADCPGHQELIETMLSSVSLMKGAIVIVSAFEPLKQKPQLIQHLIAAKMANLDKLIICLNKCDLATIQTVKERKKELDELLTKLEIKPLAIIPTSFTHKLGINNLLLAIKLYFNNNLEENIDRTEFRITRSFDINQPGINYDQLKGGCIGGSLIHGQLNKNDIVKILPGILTKQKDGRYFNTPIITSVLSFESDKKQIETVNPGGLVGILTEVDPFFCKSDGLKSNIIVKESDNIPIYNDIKISYIKIDEFEGNWIPKINEKIFIQVANMSSDGKIKTSKSNILEIELIKPICLMDSYKILLCIKQPILKIVGIGKLQL